MPTKVTFISQLPPAVAVIRLQTHIENIARIDGEPLTHEEVRGVTSTILNTLVSALDPQEVNAIAKTVRTLLSTRDS